MKKFIFVHIVIFILFFSYGFAGNDLFYEIGKKVTELKLKNIEGEEFDLEETIAHEDVKGVVFVFISPKCPASVKNDERYVQHAKNFKKDGILFIGVSSNFSDSIEELQKYAEKKSYNFPILKDHDNIIADRFAARTTPHAFFIDKEGILRYHGRIDDSLYDATKVTDATLENVVKEYLSGKELSVTQTKPGG